MKFKIIQNSRNFPEDLRDIFKRLDSNTSGLVDPSMFKKAIRELGVEFTEEEVTQLVKFFDKSSTGKIPYEEFLSNLLD